MQITVRSKMTDDVNITGDVVFFTHLSAFSGISLTTMMIMYLIRNV